MEDNSKYFSEGVYVMRMFTKYLLIGFVLLVLFIVPVSADLPVTNSTLREFTQTAYPIELFYAIFFIGFVCLILDIFFVVSSRGIPASAMIIT